jgi:hypothetical protein
MSFFLLCCLSADERDPLAVTLSFEGNASPRYKNGKGAGRPHDMEGSADDGVGSADDKEVPPTIAG